MATLFVNSDGSAEFTTIFAAIEAASAGDTIEVAAGTYDEDLLIDKAVTILGAQDGVDGTDALRDAALGVGETTIVGLSRITASGDVTIDGVRFLNDVSTTGGGSILRVESEGNHVITNSIFYSEVNGAANGVTDRAISIPPLTTGTVEISNNYFTGAAEGAFSDASWDRGIFFDGGGIDVTIEGNTFEFTRTGINLDDTSGVSPATVAGNTFITNGTGTSVAFNLDNVSFADNNYEDTREDFNFRNLTTDIVFDAEVAVAAVTPVNPVVDPVVVLGGIGNDAISGTAGSDVLDANASGISVADNDMLEGRGGNDLLIGRGGDDTLKGGEGTDVLLGGAGNDVLDGEQGNDQIIGGDGDDTYIYRPGSAADTFNGFVAGLNTDDHVDISAFTGITSFAQVLSLATQVGEDTVIDFGGGDVLTLANVLMGSLAEEDFILAPPLVPPRPTSDFDGDGKSDILWQDDNGTAAVWLIDGSTTPTFVGAVGTNPGPTWETKKTGDFNGDGKSDIIWQGADGTASMWLMDGSTTPTFVGAVGTNPGPSWEIKGTGDFNGDGKSDIIWQGADGTASMWLMDGSTPTFVGAVGTNPGPSWEIKGTGDFNGDGKSDIIWQGADGTASMWLMDGSTTPTFVGAVGTNPGPSWEIKGTGDFNGDGKSDIIWQGADGTASMWLMDGSTTPTFVGAVGTNPGPSWEIKGTGDFNGDGKSDIIWQGADGTASMWLMDGSTTPTFVGAVGTNPGPTWDIIA